jgi:hypothetical protein
MTKLSRAGISCTYLHLPALPSYLSMATTPVTTVFLGAHSLHSNGAVFARAGTALVSMVASERYIPVVVCCETYKFSEGVMLDGFMRNELGELSSNPSQLVQDSSHRFNSTRTAAGSPAESGSSQPALRLDASNKHHGCCDRGGDHTTELHQLNTGGAGKADVVVRTCPRVSMPADVMRVLFVFSI